MVLPNQRGRDVSFRLFVRDMKRKAELSHVQFHAITAFVAVNPDDARVETYAHPDPNGNGFHNVMELIEYDQMDPDMDQTSRYMQSLVGGCMALNERSNAELAYLRERLEVVVAAITAEHNARG